MEVINLKSLMGKDVTHIPRQRHYGFTIKHNKPIGWMGTTGEYLGWYRYKKDATKRLKEIS
jgi:hypothetical protein